MNRLFYGYGPATASGMEMVMEMATKQKYQRYLEFLAMAYDMAPRETEALFKRQARRFRKLKKS